MQSWRRDDRRSARINVAAILPAVSHRLCVKILLHWQIEIFVELLDSSSGIL